jgi:hypothetical protein
MILKELQLLSEALWESVKSDLKFFSPIQVFVKKLSEVDLSERSSIADATLYASKIEEFFSRYRGKGVDFYIPPPQTSKNDKTVKSIVSLLAQLNNLSPAELSVEIDTVKPKPQEKAVGGGKIFIGHGRSKLWARLQLYIKDDLGLETLVFEDESRTSQTMINILSEF